MSGFWQKRRAAVAAEAEAEARLHEARAAAAEEAALAERSDDDLLAEFDLPAPEDLVSGEQLRAFLKAQLPQRLKTRALRSFWKTNPVLACLDGLNDYDDDYTAAATAGKPVNTIYKVGRGMVAKVEEVLTAEADAPEEAVEAEAPALAPTHDVVVPGPRRTETALAQDAPYEAQTVTPEEDAEAQPAPTHRRMRFHFASDLAQDMEGSSA
ncbi:MULTISPECIES: DUF3306 domain-containing protein [unclassified Sulfitobacter]|uniref:DUF3306 domain-containing protein n=1 Tax=unclassified Sulfitobacter TaxID=196795 RepID=UPI001AD9A2DE|nr:DUF3306 domain-containing protein [Sulfitobacter sp. R18_1]MBO9431921.1 DUF3306 domain-containing protein [Sulfitobacter sp. R18_1]